MKYVGGDTSFNQNTRGDRGYPQGGGSIDVVSDLGKNIYSLF